MYNYKNYLCFSISELLRKYSKEELQTKFNAFYDKYINDDFEKEYVPKVFEEDVKNVIKYSLNDIYSDK